MIRLRLFHRDDPATQIDTRSLGEGELCVGRGADADWRVDDPERGISRRHLVLAQAGGMLTLRDVSSAGVFLGSPRQRVERERAVPISRGEPVHFGAFVIVAEEDEADAVAPEPILDELSPFEAPAGTEPERGAAMPRRPDPFGSALRPDPIALDEPPSPDGVDAWERRRSLAAGDWNAKPAHLQAEHGRLIGTPQRWSEPPPPAAEAGFGFDAPFTRPILAEPPAGGGALVIPNDWDVSALAPAPSAAPGLVPTPEPMPAPPPAPPAPPPVAASQPPAAASVPLIPAPAPAPLLADDHLFDAFCTGARLAPDAFAGEDRAALMERLGGIYRQAILGIADLMSERTALKNDFRMARTTIKPEANNPFKWVPPQRIAVDLLRPEEGSGYLTGERALNDALGDIKAHLLCTLAGMRAALGATFDLLSPAEVDARVASRTYLTRGQRDSATWTEFAERFTDLRREADDSAEGPINKAFRHAYEQQAGELDGRRGRG